MDTWASRSERNQHHDLQSFRQARGRSLSELRAWRQDPVPRSVAPPKNDLATCIKESVDAGAVGALLVGNYGDAWTREGDLGRVGEFVSLVKAQGIIAGVAGHELRTIMQVEKAGIKSDFHMKTLHSTNYWSKRRPDQTKEVIDE